MVFAYSTRDILGMALAVGAAYIITGIIVALRKALRRSQEAAVMTEGDPTRCPHCGFRYAFDGYRCGHCWRKAHDRRYLWMILLWPSDLWRIAARRIRQVIADRHAEPLNSHPGIIVSPGTPVARAMQDSCGRRDSSSADWGSVRDGTGTTTDQASALRENSSVRLMADILHGSFQQIQDIISAKSKLAGIPTGFFELDDILCGLGRGQLVVVAGRPSMGKTSFAMSVLQQVALAQGLPVLLFSPGMTGEQLSNGMLCSHARVDASFFRSARLSEEEFQKLVMAAGAFHEARIFIDDSPDLLVSEISETSRMMVEGERIALIIIDDLHLVKEVSGHGGEPSHPLGRISTQLRALARELGVPILVASQVHRSAENRRHCRPCLSDLRGPHCLEEDADTVLLLYRDEYYNPESVEKGVCEIIVAKNRMGPTGVTRLAFLKEYTRFENLARPLGIGS